MKHEIGCYEEFKEYLKELEADYSKAQKEANILKEELHNALAKDPYKRKIERIKWRLRSLTTPELFVNVTVVEPLNGLTQTYLNTDIDNMSIKAVSIPDDERLTLEIKNIPYDKFEDVIKLLTINKDKEDENEM